MGIPYIWCVYAKGPGWLVAFRVFICMVAEYGKAHRLGWALCYVWCGGVLLSHTLSGAVPSPCQVLASGFGMGPGVSPGPWPPQIFNCPSPPFLGGPGCVVVRGPVGGRDARVFVTVDQVCGWSG